MLSQVDLEMEHYSLFRHIIQDIFTNLGIPPMKHPHQFHLAFQTPVSLSLQ